MPMLLTRCGGLVSSSSEHAHQQDGWVGEVIQGVCG